MSLNNMLGAVIEAIFARDTSEAEQTARAKEKVASRCARILFSLVSIATYMAFWFWLLQQTWKFAPILWVVSGVTLPVVAIVSAWILPELIGDRVYRLAKRSNKS